MANTTVEKDLIGLEKQYWQAMKDGDVETAIKLTDFPCLVTGPEGVGTIDEASYRKMMDSMPYEIRDIAIKDVKVRMISDDVAVLAYKIHEELTVDGKDLSIDAADSSTWIRKNGSWACALHNESILCDPLGRKSAEKR